MITLGNGKIASDVGRNSFSYREVKAEKGKSFVGESECRLVGLSKISVDMYPIRSHMTVKFDGICKTSRA